MSPDQIFQITSQLVLPGWLLLLFASNWKWTSRIVIGIVVTILSAMYAFFVFQAINLSELSNFGSLQGVMELFTDPLSVTVGWIHYLAFDLLVGWLIVFDARREGINRWLLIPCLFFTFMLGPVGFLLYMLLRLLLKKKYFIAFN